MRARLVVALRRVVLAPLVLALTALLWATLPVWLLLAAVLSPFVPGHWRAWRLFWLGLTYLTCSSFMLLVMFAWWLAAGFGARLRTPYWEGVHYDLVEGLLWAFYRAARRVLHLELVTEGPAPDAHPGRPLVVCCRHAGPGDSFILMYTLMHWYAREPRVVLKNTLAWDPTIDVVLHRLHARFISPNPAPGADLEAQIASLVDGLDSNDAFVIFPEGGNFTEQRRTRGIERLQALGLHGMARRAAEMEHVLAPRPGGLMAALDAAPLADVVWVAHTGLDHMLGVADVWRELPMDKRLVMRWWHVPSHEVPTTPEERIDWLYDWWDRIDDWITEQRPEPLR